MRLDAARSWYIDSMSRLDAIGAWIRAGKPEPYEDRRPRAEQSEDARSLNRVLAPALSPYLPLSRQRALEQLMAERDDVRRSGLVRLFSGFEADFRRALAARMKAAWDALDPGSATRRREEDVLAGIPPAIESCLQLFQRLEPRFSGAEKGWLDKLRGWRNDFLHGGFALDTEQDFEDAYHRLRRIVSLVSS